MEVANDVISTTNISDEIISNVTSSTNTVITTTTGISFNNQSDNSDLSVAYANYLVVSVGICSLMLALCICGTVGNIITIVVFSSKGMRSPINMLISWLSVVDIFLLGVAVALFVIPGFNAQYHIPLLDRLQCYAFAYVYPLAMAGRTCSVWMMVLITFERFMAVCYPFLSFRIMSIRHAHVAVACTFLPALVYNVPRFWEFQVYYINEIPHVYPFLRRDHLYILIYYTILFLITHFLVPFLILISLNGYVIRRIQAMNRERRYLMSSAEQGEYRTAQMMVVVIVIFILTNTMPFVQNIVESIYPLFFTQDSTLIIAIMLTDFSNTLVVANSSTNCIIYFVYSKRYRDCVIGLFCPGRKVDISPEGRISLFDRTTGISRLKQFNLAAISQRLRISSSSRKLRRSLSSSSAAHRFGKHKRRFSGNHVTIQNGLITGHVQMRRRTECNPNYWLSSGSNRHQSLSVIEGSSTSKLMYHCLLPTVAENDDNELVPGDRKYIVVYNRDGDNTTVSCRNLSNQRRLSCNNPRIHLPAATFMSQLSLDPKNYGPHNQPDTKIELYTKTPFLAPGFYSPSKHNKTSVTKVGLNTENNLNTIQDDCLTKNHVGNNIYDVDQSRGGVISNSISPNQPGVPLVSEDITKGAYVPKILKKNCIYGEEIDDDESTILLIDQDVEYEESCTIDPV